MSEQIVLRCEDSLEGIFTALFDAFVCKNKMKAPYTDSISIAAGEGEMTLFAREIEVQTDAQKVQRTGGQQFLDIWCVHLHRDVVFPISLPIRLHFG